MRPEKIAIVNEIRSRINGAAYLILVNYRGMKAGQAKELRKRLAKQKSEWHVVKNSYFQRAAADLPGMAIEKDINVPLSIVYGNGDGVGAAKIISDFARENNTAAIISGFLEGRAFSAEEFGELVKLPARPMLLGMLACALASPISGLAGVMRQKVASLLYALQAVQKLKGNSDNK